MSRGHPLIVVAGTGTEIGKTHVAVALLEAWGRLEPAHGYKPVETGVSPAATRLTGDAARLARVATFHVKRTPFRQTFAEPISPHLAARKERRRVDLGRLAEEAQRLAADANLVVELAGGLFSPLEQGVVNADLARRIRPDILLVVAPDRLGVLHDVGATVRAARATRLRVDGVILSTPARADASTGTNAAELRRVVGVHVVGVFPRARRSAEATRRTARQVLRELGLDD